MLPLLNEFKEELIRGNLAPTTIRNILKAIIYFSKHLESEDMKKVSKNDIDKYKTYLVTEYITHEGHRLCNETITLRLSALNRYFGFLCRSKVVFFDPTLHLEFPKKTKRLPGYIPNEKDIEELLNEPDTYTYVGIRDRLLMELAYSCPLRNKELRELSLQNIDMENRYIYPKRAKGGYECGIPIIDGTFQALEKYLQISRPRLLKHTKRVTDRLFLTERGTPFEGTIINEIFQKYRGSKRIYPHAMRHACAIHMLRRGASIRDVQALLGHRSIKTTQIYTPLTSNDLKDLHTRFHPRERWKKCKEIKQRVKYC